jgi:hypothetical protein
MRPNDLADEVGVTELALRTWLRAVYPRSDAEHGASWDLSPAQVAAARAAFAERRARGERRVQAVSGGTSDWYWEGNVQTALVRYLRREGWKIEATADTATKAQGDDIRATKDGQTLRVEVKGWPTKGYADPLRAAETKRTTPSTQAGHWYSQAILRVMRDLGRHPGDLVSIGLPDWPRFRALIADTEAPLKRLRVAVLLVGEKGQVETRIDWPKPRGGAQP